VEVIENQNIAPQSVEYKYKY